MVHYSAVGTPVEVRDYLEGFAEHANADADADELIIAHQASNTPARLRSVELTADVMAAANVG